MIEHGTINGQNASVMYMTDSFEPTTKDKATLVKVIFADGRSVFGTPVKKPTKDDDLELWSPDPPAGGGGGNPCHNPPGSPEGGQFCSTGGAGGGPDAGQKPDLADIFSWEKMRDKLKSAKMVDVRGNDFIGTILAEGDDGIIKFRAGYSPGTNNFHVDWAEVTNDAAGREGAKEILQTVYDTAQETGAKAIHLDAGLQSGGYVWAKMGFNVDPHSINNREFQTQINDRLAIAEKLIPSESYQAAIDIMNHVGPDSATRLANLNTPISEDAFRAITAEHPSIAQWAKQRGTTYTVGKALLAGTSYFAKMPRTKFHLIQDWVKRVSGAPSASLVPNAAGPLNASLTGDAADTMQLSDLLWDLMNSQDAKDYNECHDPDTGRFCSTGGGSGTTRAEDVYNHNVENDPTPTEDEFLKELTPEERAAIQASEDGLAAGTPTNGPVDKGGFMQPDGTYTPERQALHDQILHDIFTDEAVAAATPAPGEEPTAILLGGRSGSGKTTAVKNEFQFDKNNPYLARRGNDTFIALNADEIQLHLPGYRGEVTGLFNGEAQDIVARAETTARRLGINMVYDATMKTTGSAVERVQQLRNEGYRVEGYFVHTTPHESAKRVVNRFMGKSRRYVPPVIPLKSTTNEKTFDTLKPALGKWVLYDNNGPKPIEIDRGGTEVVPAGSLVPIPGMAGAPTG